MIEWKIVLDALERTAPPALAEAWDNSGLQCFWAPETVSRILVCLDLTESAVDKAVEGEAELIVCHHPVFFEGIKQIDGTTALGRMIRALAANGISVYAAHMTYDKAPWGNTAAMAGRLGFDGVPAPGPAGEPSEDYSVLLAELAPALTGEELCRLVCARLDIPMGELRYAGNPDIPLSRVLLCAGGGADLMDKALGLGCQALVTGDMKYHQALRAAESGFFLLDAGHFATERTFPEDMADRLQKILGDSVQVLAWAETGNPIRSFAGRT